MFFGTVRDQCTADNVDKDQTETVLIELGDMCSVSLNV